jgi:hypothetical protein
VLLLPLLKMMGTRRLTASLRLMPPAQAQQQHQQQMLSLQQPQQAAARHRLQRRLAVAYSWVVLLTELP